ASLSGSVPRPGAETGVVRGVRIRATMWRGSVHDWSVGRAPCGRVMRVAEPRASHWRGVGRGRARGVGRDGRGEGGGERDALGTGRGRGRAHSPRTLPARGTRRARDLRGAMGLVDARPRRVLGTRVA